jgi:hypothetical protein
MLERLNQELKRRTRVVRIFPNAASCLRLIRALAVETYENWLEAIRYLKHGASSRAQEGDAAQARRGRSRLTAAGGCARLRHASAARPPAEPSGCDTHLQKRLDTTRSPADRAVPDLCYNAFGLARRSAIARSHAPLPELRLDPDCDSGAGHDILPHFREFFASARNRAQRLP